MRQLTVRLKENSYPIYIGVKILSQFGKFLRKIDFPHQLTVVTHRSIRQIYGKVVDESLRNGGFYHFTIEVPEGESVKSLQQAEKIYEALINLKMGRDSGLVAFGGGVIGDLTGFVAATYLRGIPYVQLPTTLLAQVDSSIGGKVGVDLPVGKNLVGAFWQPRMVFSDVSILTSLSRREMISGVSEAIKCGIIADKGLFTKLNENMKELFPLKEGSVPNFEFLKEIVERCAKIKAEVTEKDEREKNLRAILNYGHTFGHAIEVATNYEKYTHGEAIAIGMVGEGIISKSLGLLKEEDLKCHISLLKKAGLPTSSPGVSKDRILEGLKVDKKKKEKKLRFVLAEKTGKVRIEENIPQKIIEEAIDYLVFNEE